MKLPAVPIAIVGLIVIVLAVLLVTRHITQSNTVASPDYKPELAALWQDYKSSSWDADSGRTIDHASGDITTSEGQGYTMLRAVWSNDRPTFDKAWRWTRSNIQRSDKLFSWKWGARSDGSSGVLSDQGGDNTASDADTDIALALVMAGQKWQDSGYSEAGTQIIGGIWEHDVVTADGKLYLGADNLEIQKSSGQAVINPSYFAPYAYTVFAGVDNNHNWQQLSDDNYSLLQHALNDNLGGNSSAKLPPDWVGIDIRTGAIAPVTGKSTDFGYDAYRTVWRTAMDYEWSRSAASRKLLGQLGFLQRQWSVQHRLVDGYGHGGQPTGSTENTGFYGGTLGYFQYEQPSSARAIVEQKLAPLYDADSKRLTTSLNYYDNNWVWFGLALYAGQLPNIAGGHS